MNLDTVLFVVVWFVNWITGEGFPLLPSFVLGAYGFATLMLEVKKINVPIWTWTVGYAISAIWLWWFWEHNAPFAAEYGFWAEQIAHVILSAMVAFVVPFMVGLAFAVVFFLIPVLAITLVKEPEIFFGHRR